jgi:hypothetical protein
MTGWGGRSAKSFNGATVLDLNCADRDTPDRTRLPLEAGRGQPFTPVSGPACGGDIAGTRLLFAIVFEALTFVNAAGGKAQGEPSVFGLDKIILVASTSYRFHRGRVEQPVL